MSLPDNSQAGYDSILRTERHVSERRFEAPRPCSECLDLDVLASQDGWKNGSYLEIAAHDLTVSSPSTGDGAQPIPHNPRNNEKIRP
jgi:hypothetical protein